MLICDSMSKYLLTVSAATLARNVFKLEGYAGGGAATCVVTVGGVAITVDYSIGSETYVDVSDILKGLFVRGNSVAGDKSVPVAVTFEEFDSDNVTLGSVALALILSDRIDYLFGFQENIVTPCATPRLPSRCYEGLLAVGGDLTGTINGYASGSLTSSQAVNAGKSYQINDSSAEYFEFSVSGFGVVKTIYVINNDIPNVNYINIYWWGLYDGAWKCAHAEIVDYAQSYDDVVNYERMFAPRAGGSISDGYMCRIVGLDGYDMRYFSDILISDEVYVNSIGGLPAIVSGEAPRMSGGSIDLNFSVKLLKNSNL